MKPKKISADWNIAATHWLTSGFVIPLILGIVVALLLGLLLGTGSSVAESVVTFAPIIYIPLIFWLGVMYSSKYVNKTYVISNAKNIVNLSTIYLVVIGGGFRVLGFLKTGVFSTEHIGFVLAVIVFYIASKKYIRNDSVAQSA